MENIVKWIEIIAGLITSITVICVFCKKIINKGFEPVYHRLDKLDINQCRNYLVNFLSDMEAGEQVSELRIKRAYEVYDHYCELGGNSYIHDKWEKVMK